MDSFDTSTEQTVTDKLCEMGPCFLNDFIAALPYLCWHDVVLELDRMAKDGRVLILQVGLATYQIVPTPQLLPLHIPLDANGHSGLPSDKAVLNSVSPSV